MVGQPPFRAEHIGSLLRPPALTAAFRSHQAGGMTDAAFHEVQDTSIREAIALQQEAGLRVVTDGEFRRGSYWGHFIGPVEGLTVEEAAFKFRDDHGHEQAFIAPHVAGKVRRNRGISTDEFAFLKTATSATPKVTLPSPPTFHFWRGRDGIDPVAYDGPTAFFADFAQVYREEIAALAARGATYVQLDEVPLAMLCDPVVCDSLRQRGEDPDALVGIYIDAINHAVTGRPDGVTVGLHLCRGNFKGKHLSEGGYEPVAERMFNEIDVDVFFLEYDSARAGDFAPLRFVPAGKSVVLGLVSSKSAEMEAVDDLVRRIDDAGRYIAVDRLGISPQCGFASAVSGNPITIEVEKKKLSLVVETAARVWE